MFRWQPRRGEEGKSVDRQDGRLVYFDSETDSVRHHEVKADASAEPTLMIGIHCYVRRDAGDGL